LFSIVNATKLRFVAYLAKPREKFCVCNVPTFPWRFAGYKPGRRGSSDGMSGAISRGQARTEARLTSGFEEETSTEKARHRTLDNPSTDHSQNP
jgi:hypothetical protein